MKNYGIICDVGGKAKGNQDSVFYAEFDLVIAPGFKESRSFNHKVILALVCDGVSASNHGEKGSTFVIRTLSAKIINYLINNNFDPALIMESLRKLIIETNKELLKEYKAYIEKGKVPKTTLIGALIIGQYIWIFNLGDSKAFLIKDNLIGQVSKDDIGTGASHEITQALGETQIDPHIAFYNWAYENDHSARQIAFKEKYYALLCSDGLTDKVTPNEIMSILTDDSYTSVFDKVHKLYKMTMERNIDDNVSIIGIDLAKYFSEISKAQKIRLSY